MKPPQEKILYEELAALLVTPARYGHLALQLTPVTSLPIPETARIYDFPELPPTKPTAA